MTTKPGILFVDDDSLMAFTFGSNILEAAMSKDMPVHIFTDPEEAKAFLESPSAPALSGAVIDLWMIDKRTGNEDHEAGFAVIALVRARNPKAIIVVLSAHIDRDIDQRLRNKFNAVPLKKPASTDEVLEALGV
jgi:ActR/RegA family two-component response regulator